ncbi:MAG: ketoacyl-ACP synthase III [Myxococcota bacterium]|nr:ketoacyl-ACP synthase III [Myxococcota bacterium]
MWAYISGTGSYLPSRVMTNAELCERVPNCSADWIEEKLGISARRIAADEEQASDLGVAAAKNAIASAGIEPNEIDGIICAIGTGDVITPATASYIQEKLSIQNKCFAFDIHMACAGTISGITMARGLIESGMYQHILVLGTQVISRTSLDWDDRTTAPIFGDGAGAVIVSRSTDKNHRIIDSRLHTNGGLAEIVGQYGGGTRDPLTPELVAEKRHKLRMDGRAVWNCAVAEMPAVVRDLLESHELTADDIDFVVSHQANKRLLFAVLDELQIPTQKTYTNVERYGNTVAASAMVALDEAVDKQLIKSGDLIVLLAIGAGMSWGAHLIRW